MPTFYVESGTGKQVGPNEAIDPSKTYTQSGSGTQVSGASIAPSMLVTSSASRNNYSNNVNTMQSGVSSLTPPPATGSSAQTGTGNTGTGGSTTINVGGGAAKPQGDGSYKYKLANGSTVSIGDPTLNKSMLTGATFISGPTGSETDPLAGANNPQTGTDGTDTGTGGADPTAGLPPALAAQFKSSLASLDEGVASAKQSLIDATATLANDPAATAAVNQIIAKYDQQINLMKEKNRMLAGSYATSAARNGGFQYANDMTENFLSEEQDKASQRISDLISQETSMILKAQAAYKDGDVKALDAATKALDAANKGKLDAINKLLTATNNQTKTLQAQAKIDATAAKQKITDDIRVSTGLGKAMADSIKASGVTDEKQIDSYIQTMAEQNGISNPEILKSAVLKERDAGVKADLANANTTSIIAKRATGGTKKTSDTLKSDEINQIGDALNSGTEYFGTKYNGRGSDGKVDPDLYNAIYTNLKNTSASKAQQFLVKYPPAKNINPANVTNTNLDPVIVNALKASESKNTPV